MAVQLRAVSSVVTGASTLTVSKPTGTAAGDLLLLAVAITGSFTSLPLQDGWYLLPNGSINGDNSIAVWAKIAGASEPASYSVPVSTSGSTGAAIMGFYSDTGQPLGLGDTQPQNNTVSGNRIYPSVNFAAVGWWACIGHHQTFASTPAVGFTEHWDNTVSGSRLYAMSRAVGVTGATGTAAATGTAQLSKCISVAVIETDFVALGPRPRASAVNASVAAVTSISVTAPATIQAGDFLLLQLTLSAARTITDPTGWTALAPVTGAGGIYAWYKIADGSEASSSITVNFTGGGTTMSLAVTPFFSQRGWDVQLDAITSATLSSGTSVTFPSITASVANSLLCILVGRSHTTGLDPDNGVDLWRLFDLGASGSRLSLLAEMLEVSGASGTRTVAWSSGTLACTTIVLNLIEVEPVAAILRRIYPSEGYYSVVYAGIDLTAYLKIGDLTGTTEQLDTTSLADDHPTSEPGATTWQIGLEGPLTKALDDLLGKDALSPPATKRDLLITIGETGNATTYAWTGTADVGAFVSRYRVGPNVQFGEVPFRADLAVSGAPVRGTG